MDRIKKALEILGMDKGDEAAVDGNRLKKVIDKRCGTTKGLNSLY